MGLRVRGGQTHCFASASPGGQEVEAGQEEDARGHGRVEKGERFKVAEQDGLLRVVGIDEAGHVSPVG
jgi:hypothetical protein